PVSSNEMPFPSYLVRVAKDSVRLCSTKDFNGRPHYLTLSYRWGETRTFTLTLKNMKDLLVNIVEDELPKTLRDAVHITHRLGYEFIWIDSLCIIQDSKEHWQTESAIMGDIYRGSVCTIAALGAKDCGTGCFTERNPLCFQHFIFEYGEGKTAYITPELETTSLYSTGYGSTVEPLHERAWVVQERMLSPRTLFFGTYDVHWECVEKEASTRQPEMISEVPSPKYALHKACSLEVTGKFDDSYKLFWKWWSRIITQYSPCGLTYRTDKLVALHGLLTLVESKTGLTNVAGLWKEYIFPELLWYVHRPTPRPPSGNEYQAPSWAWTSLNTEVNV
ncbi:HET-domain-containing protein, partial [Agrocybe pediades]